MKIEKKEKKSMLGIFLDIETNGLDFSKHKALELAVVILDLLSGKQMADYHCFIAQPYEVWKQSDLTSLKINQITWEEICNGKEEKLAQEEIIALLNKFAVNRQNAVFICQNPSFDRVFFSHIIPCETQEMLLWPYHWLDLASMHWSKSLLQAKENNGAFPWEIGFSKDQIALHFNLEEEEKPHRAVNGVNHLILCYEAVIGFPFR